MRNTFFWLALLTGLVALGFTGCAKDPTRIPVAKVDTLMVSQADLNAQFLIPGKNTPMTFATAEEELTRKRDKINSLVDNKILVLGAIQNGLDKDTAIIKRVDAATPQLLKTIFNKKFVQEPSKVTDAEIKAAYDVSAKQYDLSIFATEDRKVSDDAYAALKSGKDFVQVVQQYSTDERAKQTGGKAGPIPMMQVPFSIYSKIAVLKAKEYTAPIEMDDVFYIIRADSVSTKTVEPLEKMKDQLDQYLRRNKEIDNSKSVRDRVLKDAKIEVNTELFRNVLNQLNAGRRPDAPPQEAMMQIQQIAQGPLGQQQIFKYRYGTYTLAKYMGAQGQIFAGPRAVTDPAKFAKAVGQYLFNAELLDTFAAQQGLKKDPEFVSQYRNRLDTELIRAFKETVLFKGLTVPDAETRAYYDANQAEFMQPERDSIQEIQLATEAEAKALLPKLGKKWDDIVSDKSIRQGAKQRKGYMILTRANSAMLFDAIAKLKPGQKSGVIAADQKYSIVRMIKRLKAEPKAFEQVVSQISGQLVRKYQDEKLTQYLTEMRTKVKIEIMEDNIAKTIDYKAYQNKTATPAPTK